MYTHKVYDDIDQIPMISQQWDAIVDSDFHGNPFLSTAWYINWLRHFVGDAELKIITICYNGDIQGVFPLVISREKVHGVRYRVLKMAENIYTPICCPIVMQHNMGEVIDVFIHQVLPTLDWDFISFIHLAPEYPVNEILASMMRSARYQTYWVAHEGNWVFCSDNGLNSEAYFSQLNTNIRNNTKRYPRKLAELGDFAFEMVKSDITDADIFDYMTVYANSWKEPEIDLTFHPDLMRVASASGSLRLGFLKINGIPIATQLWLYTNKRGYIVKLAYDEAYKKYSTGTVLTWLIVKNLIDEEGMLFFDFLRGDDDYKRNWMNTRRERYQLIAYNRNLQGKIAYMSEQVAVPKLRKSRLVRKVKTLIH